MIFNITNKSVIREFGYKRLIKLVPADLLYPKLTVVTHNIRKNSALLVECFL